MRFRELPSLKERQSSRLQRTTKSVPAPTSTPITVSQDVEVAANNLLFQIPGEASGFYLMAVDALPEPSIGSLWLLFFMALILLVMVRVLSKASNGIMATTLGAFIIWMLVLDKGVLHVMFPDLLPSPLGMILAIFYSMVVTILASFGKIK
jgi:hypothetical protein